MVENPEVVYVEGTCKALIAGRYCGKKETAEVHGPDGHDFEE